MCLYISFVRSFCCYVVRDRFICFVISFFIYVCMYLCYVFRYFCISSFVYLCLSFFLYVFRSFVFLSLIMYVYIPFVRYFVFRVYFVRSLFRHLDRDFFLSLFIYVCSDVCLVFVRYLYLYLFMMCLLFGSFVIYFVNYLCVRVFMYLF